MTFKAEAIIIAILLGLVAVLGVQTAIYRGDAIDYKAQRDKASDALNLANATIDDMQVRQRDVAALDAKYTKELADAQATIDLLHDDVATGKRRLQLNAKCPATNATGTAGVDDAASPRLADAAERNYWTLRSRIEIAGKQIAGLQQYISEQCK
ncbi:MULTISPECIES: lysis protein [unclassified Pantoea]|uniref:lysis protein n=1 Tax=unclassified Pantoea TaxID=2630326 RepID=UPI0022351476|nr:MULTISPECIES: lysis protein [unclassified Pantoea]